VNALAISVRNLSKIYKVYQRPMDVLWELLGRKKRHQEFWALRNVSLDVRRGEVVGVIGRNGAGKTTLLRIIAGTLDANEGSVEVNGKVSAIMALGTGFNLDLSGRENILIGGLVLGLTHEEIDGKMQEIIDFSGLRDFIDQPCKTYSSGMLARLSFSVASSIDPDILIVDEALATGDMVFSVKSYARMRRIARGGATVLLVTHSLPQIYELCDRAVLIENGSLALVGEPRMVGQAYEDLLHKEMEAAAAATTANTRPAPLSRHETKGFAIESVQFIDRAGRPARKLNSGEAYQIVIRGEASVPMKSAGIGFTIRTEMGTEIYGTSSADQGQVLDLDVRESAEAMFDFQCDLGPGTYYLTVDTSDALNGKVQNEANQSSVIFFDVLIGSLFAGFVNHHSKFERGESEPGVERETGLKVHGI
jgi:lipopolysaccharide transport system ATP-binding protein